MNVKQLEAAAIRAHTRGVGWSEFWQEHRPESAEPSRTIGSGLADWCAGCSVC